mmetsp:Transcript_15940/g.25885  ORF Transcript_15940/g.25885 Transcript_15940/m.25885 type:complete len:101 (-) Transcript_15940:10-312(-)
MFPPPCLSQALLFCLPRMAYGTCYQKAKSLEWFTMTPRLSVLSAMHVPSGPQKCRHYAAATSMILLRYCSDLSDIVSFCTANPHIDRSHVYLRFGELCKL